MAEYNSLKLTLTGSGVLKDGTTFTRKLEVKEAAGRSSSLEVCAHFNFFIKSNTNKISINLKPFTVVCKKIYILRCGS